MEIVGARNMNTWYLNADPREFAIWCLRLSPLDVPYWMRFVPSCLRIKKTACRGEILGAWDLGTPAIDAGTSDAY